jgi:quercetin dioxygenase-like cupin family protein
MNITLTTPNERPGFDLMGTTVRPLATEDTFELIESTVAPAGGSPPHTLDYDKVFYILEGEITLIVDGTEHAARRGYVATVPAGVAHNYENRSDAEARMLVLTGGDHHVSFLRGLATLTASGAPDPADMADHAARHGVNLLAHA